MNKKNPICLPSFGANGAHKPPLNVSSVLVQTPNISLMITLGPEFRNISAGGSCSSSSHEVAVKIMVCAGSQKRLRGPGRAASKESCLSDVLVYSNCDGEAQPITFCFGGASP